MVVQADALNASWLATVVVVPLTSNLKWVAAPGNVLLPRNDTGLPQDSIANVSRIVAIDQAVLSDRVGRVSDVKLRLILDGIDVVLGRAGGGSGAP